MTVSLGGTDFVFFVESREKTETNDSVSYQIGLLSPTAKLDAPYAKTIVDNLNNGAVAKALVEEMAAINNVTVDWQLEVDGNVLDWTIPGYAISINDETPLEVIRKVVNAVGGVIQTKPNGDLLIISKYPHAVPTWSTLIPAVTYSTLTDILSKSESLNVKPGYNAFQISNQGSTSKSVTLDVIDVDSTTKHVRGYQVPFLEETPFPLVTSGNPGISISKQIHPVLTQMPEVLEENDPEWEVIEFVDHTSTVSKPFYSLVDYDWIEDDLGDLFNENEVTIAEDGTITIVDTDNVPSESLLRIKYRTKYWQWIVSGPVDRPVQFYVPEIEEV